MAWPKGKPARPVTEEERMAARKRGPIINVFGDVGEVIFTFRARMMRFMVAKPYGLNPFDCIVGYGPILWRVQVKVTASVMNGLFHLCTRHWVNRRNVAYLESEFDFMAAYVIPEDEWFILPSYAVAGRRSLMLRPKGFKGRDPYMLYRQAWHLFREPDGLVIL